MYLYTNFYNTQPCTMYSRMRGWFVQGNGVPMANPGVGPSGTPCHTPSPPGGGGVPPWGRGGPPLGEGGSPRGTPHGPLGDPLRDPPGGGVPEGSKNSRLDRFVFDTTRRPTKMSISSITFENCTFNQSLIKRQDPRFWTFLDLPRGGGVPPWGRGGPPRGRGGPPGVPPQGEGGPPGEGGSPRGGRGGPPGVGEGYPPDPGGRDGVPPGSGRGTPRDPMGTPRDPMGTPRGIRYIPLAIQWGLQEDPCHPVRSTWMAWGGLCGPMDRHEFHLPSIF